MPESNKPLCFFLGANTPFGFVSHFDEMLNPEAMDKLYIMKGGPGTGKSTILKKISKSALKKEKNMELIHCSSDPDSLDGIVFNDIRTCVLDGTSPHVIDPKYPGAFDAIFNIFDCIDEKALGKNRKKIIELFEAIRVLHERSARFLSAAGSLLTDTYRISAETMDPSKIERLASRIAKREMPHKNRKSSEKIRFLSAITPDGPVFFQNTVSTVCDKLYVITDEYGAASRALLSSIRNYALHSGYDIITCYCPMSPNEKIEHVFIPQLKLGFCTSNKHHRIEFKEAKKMHARRFYDMEKLKAKKRRIAFNKKAASELIAETVKIMKQAKELHDELEKEYIAAMDFAKLDQKAAELAENILKKYEE